MEMVIPPRDHGPSTYRYTWDENGEVEQITRVRPDSRPFSTAERLPPGHRRRQSAQWPFQSIITNPEEPTSPSSPSQAHRRTTATTTTSQRYSAWHPNLLQLHPLASNPYIPSTSESRPRPGSQQEAAASTSPTSPTTPTGAAILPPEYVRTLLLHSTASPENRVHEGGGSGRSRTATPQLVPGGANARHRSRVADFEGFQPVPGQEDDVFSEMDLGVVVERVDSRDDGHGGGGGGGVVDERGEEEERQRFLKAAAEFGRDDNGGVGGGRSWGKGLFRGGGGGGWRAGIALNVVVAFGVLITGFVCLVVAISGVSLEAGRSAIYEGGCGAATAVDWGLHAVVNVFVVVLVAGANYAFQVLSSPTREEVDEAHRGREWLDIGVPSFRNLRRIRGGRAWLAVVVLATAAFTQVMYNAVIFVTQTAPDFKAAVVNESFLRGAAFDDISNDSGLSRPDLLTLQQQAARGELVRLSTAECIDQFGGAFETEYAAVLLVSNPSTPSLAAGVDTINNLAPDQSSIQYCLAQQAPAPTCQVNLNAPLLGSVALLNSIALVATAAVLFKRQSSFRPLATLGDAIASFLEDPDPTTQGACLLSKADVRHGRWPLMEAQYWVPKSHYWLHSISFSRWFATFIIWAVCVGLTIAGLAYALTFDPSARLSPFGTASPHALIPLPSTTPAAAAAVVASLPQLLLSALYLAVNALLTTYYLSHESSLFAAAGPSTTPLRVSSAHPVGEQTSSLYLTLPRAVSWLLMAFFAGTSLVLSQSVFAVAVRRVDVPVSPAHAIPAYHRPGAGGTPPSVVALGLSGVGLLVLLVALVVLALAVLGLGLRRAPPPAGWAVNGVVGNPMALAGGSCSAVVSARCHPLAREKGLWRRPVMWGVVREGAGFGNSHCGFTAGKAGVVGAGRNYA